MDAEDQQKLIALEQSNRQLRSMLSSRDSRILELETAGEKVCDQISQGQLTTLAVQALHAALKRKLSVIPADHVRFRDNCEFTGVDVPSEIVESAKRLFKDSQAQRLDQVPQGQLADIMQLVKWIAVMRCGK